MKKSHGNMTQEKLKKYVFALVMSIFYKKSFWYENIKKIPIGMFFDLHAKLEIDTVKFEIMITIFTH